VWKIRPQVPGEAFGHEYWMEDGVTLGYHGRRDGKGVFGFTKYDNTEAIEVDFPQDSNHYHSNTPQLIVADGPVQNRTPYVLLFCFNGTTFDGPRVLCTHRGSRHIQHLHVHPRFTPDGRQVLFTADPRGYGQVFLAEVPPFDQLPTVEEADAPKKRCLAIGTDVRCGSCVKGEPGTVTARRLGIEPGNEAGIEPSGGSFRRGCQFIPIHLQGFFKSARPPAEVALELAE